MNKHTLGQEIHKASYLTGDFLLRSGQRSSEYFDKYRFEAQPHLLKEIAQHMAKLIPQDTEALAALEMGGIPIGTALSLHTGIPCIFVRKSAKEYGTCKSAEGFDFSGKKVCIIEDVITTGGQVIESTKVLRQQNAIIDHVLCVIHRGKDSQKIDDLNLQLSPLFTMSELVSGQ